MDGAKDPEPEGIVATRQSGNLLGPVLVEEGKISLTDFELKGFLVLYEKL